MPCLAHMEHLAAILALPDEVLSRIFVHLGFLDLFAVAGTCRRFRLAAAPTCDAWKLCCQRRWLGNANSSLFQAPDPHDPSRTAVNWRQVFATDNGWNEPTLSPQLWGAGGVSAMAVLSTAAGQLLGYASNGEIHVVGVSSTAGQDPGGARWRGSVTGRQGRPPALPTSLAVLGDSGGLVAMGSLLGEVQVCCLSSSDDTKALPAVRVLTSWSECSAPVGELHHLAASSRLVALHDALEARDAASRDGLLRLLDLHSGQNVFQAREMFERYQLVACAPADEWGHEVLAASCNLTDSQQAGLDCMRCPASIPASLCYHKSHASTTALCTFDTRGPGMAQRYATHHRSIYPHLQLVRQHYLVTSHAGTPVALWDRRSMNGPVHEVQPLPTHLESQVALALPPCEHLPFHQALYLHATQDLLVGRADNGMLWLWDLSERLGWADGSYPGSWASAGAGREGGCTHESEEDYDRCPLPLGSLSLPNALACVGQGPWVPRPAVWVGQDWLAGLCSTPDAAQEGAAEQCEGEALAEDAQPANSVFWGALMRRGDG